jgi:hypothetical protein
MYDRWDNEETARKQAGEMFHYYWQKFHWMRTHTKYFFVIMTAATIVLLLGPDDLWFNMIYVLELGSIFAWGAVQIYFARKIRESYKRWGGFDGGGGRKNEAPPSGGQSPEIYGN